MDKSNISDKTRSAIEEYITNRFVIPEGFPKKNTADAAEDSLRDQTADTSDGVLQASAGQVIDDTFLTRWDPVFEYAEKNGDAEAVRRFVVKSKDSFSFRDPEGVSLLLHPAAAGKIPVITIKDTEDFESLVTDVAYKGVRPAQLSSTGAIFLFGKTNRFIILSSKPYSNVPASELGLAENDWAEKSMKIRLEHECTHYFTNRFFGSSRNNLHDELTADFFGLENAFGFYRAEYFLRFLGLIGTSGSRFGVYLKSLPEECLAESEPVLAEITKEAAMRAEAWSDTEEFRNMTHAERITDMCRHSLTEFF